MIKADPERRKQRRVALKRIRSRLILVSYSIICDPATQLINYILTGSEIRLSEML